MGRMVKPDTPRLGQDSLLELALEDEIEWVTVQVIPADAGYEVTDAGSELYTKVKRYLSSVGLPPLTRTCVDEIGRGTGIFAVLFHEIDIPELEADGLLSAIGNKLTHKVEVIYGRAEK